MLPSTACTHRKALLCTALCVALALGTASSPLLAVEVQNCGDGGPGSGSLRDVITSAASGDTIDLSQLPTKCAMADSVITLSNGEIVVAQDNLTLQGPSVGSVTITPTVGSQVRVFDHTGAGVLAIKDLTLANGNVQAGMNSAAGGCVRSDGSVFLTRSTVKNCTATSAGTYAYGGGIYALDSAVLLDSVVSGNTATGSSRGSGGGIFVQKKGLTAKYSVLRDNEASTFGGGAYIGSSDAGTYTSISYSTLEGNMADQCGAASLYTVAGVSISNSTISGNTASFANGGLCVGLFVNSTVNVANSTIAFNTGADYSGGLWVWGGSLILQSSILAHNGSDPSVPDLLVDMNATVSGADNLIMSASGNIPAGVIKLTSDPNLGPLQYNGGRTRTHALLPGSPAIIAGNNNAGLLTDQRGRGYPRVSGPNAQADIGAFQFDSIFFDDFDG